ncbi:GSCOCG00012226001-RA-CDS [Cotesia congregata]|nr:GSCOCG00012226001-RA-CDS [Cotesia congregata]
MPKNIYQFFTIMASINNSILPVAWSLMSRKSTDCYVAVIDHFKSLSQHIIVLSYMTDFETGLRKALKLSYPNATAESCYFHFIQANMKKAKKLGLLKKLENWEDGRKFFRKLLALALLPSTDIIPTFNWLLVIRTPFYLIFKDFINYFVDYWLMTIKPDGFCVYKLKNRTNNFTEAYHRRLNKFFGLHPSLWQFTASLRDFHDMTKIEIESVLLLTLPIRRAPRPNNLIRAEVLERAWDMYESNVLDIAHFIEFAAHMSPVLRNRNVMINIEDINNFINIPIYRYIAVPGNNYIVFNNDAANQLDYIIHEQPNE